MAVNLLYHFFLNLNAAIMKNRMLFNSDSFTYPGEYVPLFKGEVQRVLGLARELKVVPPPINIIETLGAYKIEIAMPGVERENILLLASGNTISVMVMNNTNISRVEENPQQNAMHSDCFTHDISVARNADVEFANAVCHSGMLRIYIPKSTGYPVNETPFNIVVY